MEVSVEPRQGLALVLFLAHADGMPDVRTLHGSVPTEDTKWIAQMFMLQIVPGHEKI